MTGEAQQTEGMPSTCQTSSPLGQAIADHLAVAGRDDLLAGGCIPDGGRAEAGAGLALLFPLRRSRWRRRARGWSGLSFRRGAGSTVPSAMIGETPVPKSPSVVAVGSS